MIRSLSALALVSSLALASPAGAQDDAARAQAREQFGTGVSLYEAGDYQGALTAFQEAYRLAPHPMVRVNMANCYEHLGRPLEALHHFERFLAEAENATRQQRREVTTAMTRLGQQVGEVRLAIAPDGALVTIDSAETRRSPILEPVRLTAGTHHVEVRLDGFRTQRREIQVAGGQSQRVDIALERGQDEPPASAVASTSTAEEPEPVAEVSTPAEEVTEEELVEPVPSGSGGWQLRLTTPVIVAGSLTAAFTVAAIIAGSVAVSANGAFESAVVRSNDASLSQAERQQAYADGLSAASTADTASIVTDVFMIGAIAAAGVTTFFVIVDGMDAGSDASSAGAASVRAAPSVGRDGGGLVLAGRF